MVDKQGNILKTFERLVAPIVHPVIHSKITELTGITEKKLEGCPDFGTVWQDFCKFSEEDFSEGKTGDHLLGKLRPGSTAVQSAVSWI